MRLIKVPRHDPYILPQRPLIGLPEVNAVIVFVKNEEMAFLDTRFRKCGQAVFDKDAADTVAAVSFIDCQVVDIAAASIMPAQD